ncbi:group III truncated hemoglobin [Aerophototrophica crusticola]|uniref:Group III truncated hemoglobin n=1 Tax=Aerophototrophica crusticola TaxID=1709002 RepID=A0A858R3C9_9PROT|nr:group III truncated hemoglobin [Rhodospirillaceae bacterium B3]
MTERFETIDDESIADLVIAFYDKARYDPLLGPVFEQAVGTDDEAWKHHLLKVHAFWSSVMLATGRYGGRPMQAHAMLPGLGPDHFRRWLALFAETAASLYVPEAAAQFQEKAERMAAALMQGIAMAREQGLA